MCRWARGRVASWRGTGSDLDEGGGGPLQPPAVSGEPETGDWERQGAAAWWAQDGRYPGGTVIRWGRWGIARLRRMGEAV